MIFHNEVVEEVIKKQNKLKSLVTKVRDERDYAICFENEEKFEIWDEVETEIHSLILLLEKIKYEMEVNMVRKEAYKEFCVKE